MEKYNIYYCSDSNGYELLKLSINSIINNCTSNYIIHCIISDLTEENKQSLLNLVKQSKNIIIKIYDCTSFLDDKFNDYYDVAYLKHISKTTMLRMYVNKFIDLTNIDKILYLDNDTYINKDLCELFNLDIDKYYIAAVRDTFVNWSSKFKYKNDEFYINRINKQNYFNGGVELLNIKNILKDDMFNKLQNTKLEPYMKCTDQDIYNIVFENGVKFIDLKYNCKWWNLFDKDDITIIHAAGCKKQYDYLLFLSYGIVLHKRNSPKFEYFNNLDIEANKKEVH